MPAPAAHSILGTMQRLLPALGLVLAALAGAQELRVPVLGEAPAVPAAQTPDGRPLLALAEQTGVDYWAWLGVNYMQEA